MRLQGETYSSKKESTKEKAEVEFTESEDPEQRAADPWIKKIQEITRQEREKWAVYKRNESVRPTLDSVKKKLRK